MNDASELQAMRNTTSSERRVSVGTSPVQLVAASPDRIYFEVCGVADAINISTLPDPSTTVGKQVGGDGLASAPVSIFVHGDLVRKGWYACSLAGTVPVTVFEVFKAPCPCALPKADRHNPSHYQV